MNETLGWIWIHLGVVSGMLLGTGFLRPGFLGGYDAPQRRLVRLGHISFFGLGVLNILYARSPIAVEAGASAVTVASAGLAIAAITMPAACGLTAWRQRLFPVFAVPVVAALVGTGVIAWSLIT